MQPRRGCTHLSDNSGLDQRHPYALRSELFNYCPLRCRPRQDADRGPTDWLEGVLELDGRLLSALAIGIPAALNGAREELRSRPTNFLLRRAFGCDLRNSFSCT